ncbi:MAG: M20/M25/M40 family metallo-hydrolase, partial [Gemmatimonadales bacterium]
MRASPWSRLPGLAAILIPLTAQAQQPDWDSADAETLRHLQHLIQINTVNPPGNEMPVARYLDSVLTAEGIETHRFEPAPGRASLVAQLKGRGEGPPVLLLGHMDVVPVEAGQWSVDPFAGVIQAGYLYGRGAIDDKGMLSVNLETMLLLKRHLVDRGLPLTRDVILVANSDEEAGGEWGMKWLIGHHPELIRGAFALNEGGRIRVVGGKPLYVAVQSAEKVAHNLKVTARGPAGHASVPLADNAIVRLGRALAAIGAHREPVSIDPTVRRFFQQLGEVWPEPRQRRAMLAVASGNPSRQRRGAEVLAEVPVFSATLRNGISPTLLGGGIRQNVIPAEAWVNLNVRTLPGQSIGAVVTRLRRVVADSMVTIEVADSGAVEAPASSFDSPMFAAIAASARELDSSLAVVPYLSPG